ncbi:MAG TPA: hypothetical protein VMY37_16300 [Thermoguttaceae bacterium]|nr:hypothetical protein [Thermoguttaceae bacterium]
MKPKKAKCEHLWATAVIHSISACGILRTAERTCYRCGKSKCRYFIIRNREDAIAMLRWLDGK